MARQMDVWARIAAAAEKLARYHDMEAPAVLRRVSGDVHQRTMRRLEAVAELLEEIEGWHEVITSPLAPLPGGRGEDAETRREGEGVGKRKRKAAS